MATRGGSTLAAYVLHRYDWSESSLILDLFTREQGRLAVAAKGAKKAHSNFRAVLLPFQRLQASVTRLKTEDGDSGADIQNLRQAEWAGGGAMLTGAAMFSGFYLNELLMKLLPRGDAHPLLFDAYAATLPVLAAGDEAGVQPALRAFELVLLRETGFLPDLAVVTATQQPLADGGRYALLPDAGLVEARAGDAALGGTDLLAIQAALDHGSIGELQQACVPALAALKGHLRRLLHYHLGTSTLRTRQVMLGVQDLR